MQKQKPACRPIPQRHEDTSPRRPTSGRHPLGGRGRASTHLPGGAAEALGADGQQRAQLQVCDHLPGLGQQALELTRGGEVLLEESTAGAPANSRSVFKCYAHGYDVTHTDANYALIFL